MVALPWHRYVNMVMQLLCYDLVKGQVGHVIKICLRLWNHGKRQELLEIKHTVKLIQMQQSKIVSLTKDSKVTIGSMFSLFIEKQWLNIAKWWSPKPSLEIHSINSINFKYIWIYSQSMYESIECESHVMREQLCTASPTCVVVVVCLMDWPVV